MLPLPSLDVMMIFYLKCVLLMQLSLYLFSRSLLALSSVNDAIILRMLRFVQGERPVVPLSSKQLFEPERAAISRPEIDGSTFQSRDLRTKVRPLFWSLSFNAIVRLSQDLNSFPKHPTFLLVSRSIS
jgi:hypothetical protein